MSHPTVKELREWYAAVGGAAGGRDQFRGLASRQSLSVVIRLISWGRDMAIKAGEWPCVCGDHDHTNYMLIELTNCKAAPCPCPEYRPELLDAK